MNPIRLAVGDSGAEIAHLHEKLALHGMEVSLEERNRSFFGPSTREAVRDLQNAHGIDPSCEVCEKTATLLGTQPTINPTVSSEIQPTPAPAIALSAIQPRLTQPVLANPAMPFPVELGGGEAVRKVSAGQRSVEGRLFFDYGLPADNVTVRIYNRGYGGVVTLIGEGRTDSQGSYNISYDPGGKKANLEVRAVDAQGQEIALSTTKFGAGEREVMNLVAPGSVQPLLPEYQRITADLERELVGIDKLSGARESVEGRDLSLLHHATGWDARLIALAATAGNASVETGIPQNTLYALFRTGLPSDKQLLARVSVEAVGKALNKAKEEGVVSLTDQEITTSKETFGRFVRETRLAATAPGGLSTFRVLLDKSGVPGDLDRTDVLSDKAKFANLYLTHRGTAQELWQEAKALGISDENINKLRLQGKLAYLTLGNADLIESLQKEVGSLYGLANLVESNLYSKDEWKSRLKTIADNNEEKLLAIVPPTYPGEKLDDRLDAYASDMARKIRISFPTQVVAQMVKNEALSLSKEDNTLSDSVFTFLKKGVDRGYQLGQTPIDVFIRRNEPALFDANLTAEKKQEVIESVKVLHRLYQITPGDEALKVLLEEGITSAYDICELREEDFLNIHGPSFSSKEEAKLVYRKAQQVTTVTYTFSTIAKQFESTPQLSAISGSLEKRQEVKSNLIKQYPSMESLFGSLDFCECEHCRSVLSPAAYFVDLLQFLDPREKVWEEVMKQWERRHDGAPYPLKNQSELIAWKARHSTEVPPPQKPPPEKPFDVLRRRRPDLEYLPLTCENTNTVMPYIDIVNETLEYYVANKKLDGRSVHDTGTATTPELLAEPHNIIRGAYEQLKEAHYPLGLPFDMPLETVRRFLDHFEMPFWQVLEVFRSSDDLFGASAPDTPYYRAPVLAEYLGLSPAEYAIFTDTNKHKTWHLLYGFDDPAPADNELEALTSLRSAKALSRRLGISYQELADVVQTSFVNPALDTLSLVWKLGLGVSDVIEYFENRTKPEYAKKKQDFEDQLQALNERYKKAALDSATELENLYKSGVFGQTLVLRDPSGLCSFDETELEFADGQHSNDEYALIYLKTNLFVRLWRRLGWTIEETDLALRTFVPEKSRPLTMANLASALQTVLVYIAHLKALDERVKVGKNGRLKLLTHWSHLPTTSRESLYAQLFLTRSVLKNDPVFDHPLGNYLSDPNIFIKDHLLALQGALNLTADEITRILVDTDRDPAKAELSLENVSLLYRYRLLAKGLKLSIHELITLKEISGINPFEPLKKHPLSDYPRTDDETAAIEADFPFSKTLYFIEIAEKVKQSGFRIEDLDYLLRHRFEPGGRYRPDSAALLALVKTVADEISRVKEEHAIPADANNFTDELLRQKLGLILPADVVETFLAMWTGTIEYEVRVESGNPLRPDDFAQEPDIRQVIYSNTRREQRLTYRGVLLDDRKKTLEAAYPTAKPLLEDAQQQAKGFFERFFVREAPLAGFLEASDFEKLFAPIPDSLPDNEKQMKSREKREILADAFLPFLQRQLVYRFVVQILANSLGADPVLTEALLTDTKLLKSLNSSNGALLGEMTSANTRGLDLEFFDSAGKSLGKSIVVVASTVVVGSDGKSLKPAEASRARLEGYFEAPEAGAYRFFLKFSAPESAAELSLTHLPDPLIKAKATPTSMEASAYTELQPGILYQFILDLTELKGGDVELLILGDKLPKSNLGQLRLYPRSVVDQVGRARILLAKTIQLIQGLGLNEREIRYLLTHPADFDGLDLSKLPTQNENTPATQNEDTLANTLFKQFVRLTDYTWLKRELVIETDDLITIFANARRATPEPLPDLCHRVAVLTRRPQATVEAACDRLDFGATDFAQEMGIWRLWKALQIIEKLGVPVKSLISWLTPEPDWDAAQALRNTVKARYEPENWQRIAQPIFDGMRQRQRDALVAYIMHQEKFERKEQLFEYFLMDPGMEPVVQTSRLLLAVSSVQLFVQRCLLNMEPDVHPSIINTNHWQWMKRYRVWEANRRIFLFPENFLEPEFRDDKTHLFLELESALLQGDVSNDLAEDAFFHYLKGLEELARLEIVTMYCQEKPLDPQSNTVHVIGRSYSLPHRYFYRRYAHQMWTPWEPVTVEIEGDHVVAVIWRERLHLFWITFLEKGENDPANENLKIGEMADMTVSAAKPIRKVEIQLNWSEYFQGQWTTRQSSGFGNPLQATVDSDFNNQEVSIHTSKENIDGVEGAVNVHLLVNNYTYGAFRIVSKNGNPEPKYDDDSLGPSLLDWLQSESAPPEEWPYGAIPYLANEPLATQLKGEGKLITSLREKIALTIDGIAGVTWRDKDILRLGEQFRLLISSNFLFETVQDEIKALVSPFFYQDNQHTLFIEPTLTETIEEWAGWAGTTPMFNPWFEEDGYWDDLPVEVDIPPLEISNPIDLIPSIEPTGLFTLRGKTKKEDWLTNPATLLRFGDGFVWQDGGIGSDVLPVDSVALGEGVRVNIRRDNSLAPDTVGGSFSRNEVDKSISLLVGRDATIIDSGGLSAHLGENLKKGRNVDMSGDGFSGRSHGR